MNKIISGLGAVGVGIGKKVQAYTSQVADNLVGRSRRYHALQADLDGTSSELKSTREALGKSQGELEATKATLGETSQALASTSEANKAAQAELERLACAQASRVLVSPSIEPGDLAPVVEDFHQHYDPAFLAPIVTTPIQDEGFSVDTTQIDTTQVSGDYTIVGPNQFREDNKDWIDKISQKNLIDFGYGLDQTSRRDQIGFEINNFSAKLGKSGSEGRLKIVLDVIAKGLKDHKIQPSFGTSSSCIAFHATKEAGITFRNAVAVVAERLAVNDSLANSAERELPALKRFLDKLRVDIRELNFKNLDRAGDLKKEVLEELAKPKS